MLGKQDKTAEMRAAERTSSNVSETRNPKKTMGNSGYAPKKSFGFSGINPAL